MHVCQLGSYLVVLVSAGVRSLGGSFRMGAQGKPWSLAPRITCTACVGVSGLMRLLPGVMVPYAWDCPCLSPWVLYLYPSFDGIPTVNPWHLMQAADLNPKKTRSTPMHSCKHVYTENPTSYPISAFSPNHIDPQLATLLFYLYLPSLICICRLTSSRWPLSGRLRDIVKLLKNPVQKQDRWNKCILQSQGQIRRTNIVS